MTSVPPLPGMTVSPSPAANSLATVLGGEGVLAKLAAGTIEVSIIRAAVRGVVLARTPAGDVSLRLPFPLPEGSRLTLQAPPGPAAAPTLRVLAVNGRPLTAAGLPAPPAAVPAPAAAATASTTPLPTSPAPPMVAANAAFPATLMRGSGAPLPAPGGTASAPAVAGTILTVRLVAVEPSPTTPAPAPPAQAPLGPPPASAAGPLPTLTGVVAPNSHAGQPLVQTPIGLLALSTGTILPAGATVILQVEALLAPPPPTPPLPLPAAAPGGQWPALTEAVQVLQRADPAAAETLTRILPQPDGRTVANIAVFAAAMRSGDARAWLGDALGALDRSGRKDVADRLEEDVGELSGRLRQPANGEWRALPLPFFGGEAVEAIRVVIRRPPGSDGEPAGEAAGDDGIRFLVDLTLSQLGPLQIDGLVRRSNKRFDLVLRTKTPLPAEARADIAGIFAKTLEGLGMSGSAAFKVTERFVETAASEAASWRGVVV